MDEYYLTAGELRRRLAYVPDDTPVYYQHIEDTYIWQNGWQPLVIEDKNNPHEHFRQYDYYHRAFTAFTDYDGDGNRIFSLTAHY